MIDHKMAISRMKTNKVMALIFLIASVTFAQEVQIDNKYISKSFPTGELSTSQIIGRAEAFFMADNNPDKNVVELIDTNQGQLQVTGETKVLYKNIGKELYPKRSGMAEVLESGFGYLMEIKINDKTFDISYKVVNMKKEMYGKEDLFYDCINFNEINQEDVERYNKAMNKLLKANLVFKKRRELFIENSKFQFEEVSSFLLNEGELKIFSLHEAIISGE